MLGSKYTKRVFIGIFIILWSAFLVWLATGVERVRQEVHYHANIAMMIAGERIDISSDDYMEDIGACKYGSQKGPEDRVHLHENNMDVIHIHDDGVTWGHFLKNIGYAAGFDHLQNDQGEMFRNNGKYRMVYVLNGRVVTDPSNAHIMSEDRLLISYTNKTEEAVIADEYVEVLANAKEYNGKYDPGTCQTDVKQNPLFKIFAEIFGHRTGSPEHESR